MRMSRRGFMAGAATSAAFIGLSRALAGDAEPSEAGAGYGPLQPDPAGLFDLPEGFSYAVVSRAGQAMDDGLVTPGKFDGMACFGLSRDRVALVRNHEIKPADVELTAFGPGRALAGRLDRSLIYDHDDSGPMGGATTTLVWDLKQRRLVSQRLSLAGTSTNCAGGATPRGSWLSCEETTQLRGQGCGKDHGWVFEVAARSAAPTPPAPIAAMGRFRHEAAATDPRTGVVYLTEDQGDGLLYRYLPNDVDHLLAGGRLQALALKADRDADLRNWAEQSWVPGDWRETVWIDLDGVDNPHEDLRQRGRAGGAALLARGEGLFFGNGALFIACTSGGPTRTGQILRYVPSEREGKRDEADQPGRLQLFVEPSDRGVMDMCDNLAVSPWGHLFLCEDKAAGRNMLKAVTPGGRVYAFGRNPVAPPAGEAVNTELAGVCFSPEGSTCFVNLYRPGVTLAITGPWERLKD